MRRRGGLIQAAFAALWLVLGSLAVGSPASIVLVIASGVILTGVFAFAIKSTSGIGAQPIGAEAKRVQRDVKVATLLSLAASIALLWLCIATGHGDWVLPSIAIANGPLLLWLDHRFDIPRYRPVGWALIVGPVILVVTMSGSRLVAATGLAAGILLLISAGTGFRELAGLHRQATETAPAGYPPPLT